MAFSRVQAIEDARAMEIRRAINMVRVASNPSNEGSANKEFISKHPSWIKSYQNNKNVVELKKDVNEMFDNKQKAIADRDTRQLPRKVRHG